MVKAWKNACPTINPGTGIEQGTKVLKEIYVLNIHNHTEYIHIQWHIYTHKHIYVNNIQASHNICNHTQQTQHKHIHATHKMYNIHS